MALVNLPAVDPAVLFQIGFFGGIIIIAIIAAWYISKWALRRRHYQHVATTLALGDPKTGLCRTIDILDYDERPASIRWMDEMGKVNRRNTFGHPTLQLGISGIDRMYVCSTASKTCQTTEALCGEQNDLTGELAGLADRTISLWDEQNADMQPPEVKLKQIWWQLVLGVVAGMGAGALLIGFLHHNPPPPAATNSTAAMIQAMLGR